MDDFAEVEQIIAQRVANAIETIAIYEQRPVWLRSTNQIQTARRKDIRGACSTTLADVCRKGEITNGWAIKLDIVGP
ncbi:hypothetical protein Tco_0719907 [Tanacetum coccineum]